jgi:hypothetical protein
MKLDISSAPIELHARLALAGSFEEFLERLGHRTRKNFRYYTKRVETDGHTYLEQLSMAELRDAARQLRQKCRMPGSVRGLERALNWIAQLIVPYR